MAGVSLAGTSPRLSHQFPCISSSSSSSSSAFSAHKKLGGSSAAAAAAAVRSSRISSSLLPQPAIPSSSSDVQTQSLSIPSPGVTWAQLTLQGARSEMEDDVVLHTNGLSGFSFAAVFDGHAGFSTVHFLREELYKECMEALNNGLLLDSGDFNMTQDALAQAFLQADNRLLSWLEETGDDIESGSTATVIFLRSDTVTVAHVGDSRAVISRHGKAEIITGDHRPFGGSKTALAEIKRIRKAGGWINNGRVCGILAVSRAFGDRKLKTLRQKMLAEGVAEGRWTEKFVSRIQFDGDWITAFPDVYQTNLNDAEFVILASDGLWDCISSSDAVHIIRDQLYEHGNAQRACEALATAALERDAQDNISVVLADLGRIQRQGHRKRQNVGSELGQAILTVSIVVLGVWLSQFARNWAF